jgi:DNA-binding PadR family transcriptional regulator
VAQDADEIRPTDAPAVTRRSRTSARVPGSSGPACRGYGLRLDQISGGVFQVNAGSLFPALRRLERDGLIAADWRTTENNRLARWYALTAAGRKRLRAETRDWETSFAAILRAKASDL